MESGRWPRWSGPVVVGTDGSEAGLRAVRWGAAEAARHGEELRILHAIGMPDFFPGGVVSPSTELFSVLEEASASVVRDAEAAARAVDPDVSVTARSTAEPPVVALIAESGSARCLVLGESGHGAFAGLLLGSTTVTLSAHAHSPVVVVRGSAENPDGPVVVGVDGSELSDLALGCAFEQAAARGARLVAVHAFSDEDPKMVFREERMEHDWEPLEVSETRVLEHSLEGWSQRYPGVDLEEDVEPGKPRQRLIAHSEGASLVVVGSRGRGGFTGLLLGSTSQALLHHAACPVMVVRPELESEQPAQSSRES